MTHQTVERCLRRAEKLGVMEALDESPRPGRERIITEEARTFVVDLACRKPKDLGYPHELWTTRLLTRHIREHGPAVGHKCLANLAQGTLCKILAAYEIKPHKVHYYLERRNPLFDEKMAEVLCVYREVEVLKQSAIAQEQETPAVAIISYDEKPGVQAIGTTAPDLPPEPLRHGCVARDHEYVQHGTLSLLAGIDLVTGAVHATVEERHCSREFVGFLRKLDAAYPPSTAIKLILDIVEPAERESTESERRFDDAEHRFRSSFAQGVESPAFRRLQPMRHGLYRRRIFWRGRRLFGAFGQRRMMRLTCRGLGLARRKFGFMLLSRAWRSLARASIFARVSAILPNAPRAGEVAHPTEPVIMRESMR